MFDVHGMRTESAEGQDEMSYVELFIKVNVDGHVLFTVPGLPPTFGTVSVVFCDHVLDEMTVFVGFLVTPSVSTVTEEAFSLIFQMGDYTVTFSTGETTSGRSPDLVLSAHQKISSGRITRSVITEIFFRQFGRLDCC